MNWKNLQKKRNRAISSADKSYTKWCNAYHIRRKIITCFTFLLLLTAILSGVVGFHLNTSVRTEEVIVTNERVVEVCNNVDINGEGCVIISGDTMSGFILDCTGRLTLEGK